MKTLNRTAFVSGLLASALLVSPACAQSSDKHQHSDAAAPADLGADLRQLQGKVAELEAALAAQHREKYSTTGQPAMNSMKKMGGMGMKKMSGMKGMSQDSDGQMSGMGMGMMGKGMGGMGMMSMMKGKKGMMGMGMMGMNPAMSSDSMSGMEMRGRCQRFATLLWCSSIQVVQFCGALSALTLTQHGNRPILGLLQ